MSGWPGGGRFGRLVSAFWHQFVVNVNEEKGSALKLWYIFIVTEELINFWINEVD